MLSFTLPAGAVSHTASVERDGAKRVRSALNQTQSLRLQAQAGGQGLTPGTG